MHRPMNIKNSPRVSLYVSSIGREADSDIARIYSKLDINLELKLTFRTVTSDKLLRNYLP